MGSKSLDQLLSLPRYSALPAEVSRLQSIGVNVVKGPFDAFVLRKMQNALALHDLTPPMMSSYVFLLSPAKPTEDVDLTYIGGSRITADASVEWPTDSIHGKLPFIAQIDFSTVDCRKGKPALLQLFGDIQHRCFGHRWVIASSMTEDGPAFSRLRFYGRECVRIPSYPASSLLGEENGDRLYSEDGQELTDIDFCLTPLGLSLGPSPYIPAHAVFSGTFANREILACVPTIYPQPDRSFEFVDTEKPLTSAESESLRLVVGPKHDADSFGIIYACRNIISDQLEILLESI